MNKLFYTYERIKKVLGEHIEPLASVQLVEEYRRYWRPDRVKIILLAESHVYTSDDDRSIIMPALAQLPRYPMQEVRTKLESGIARVFFTVDEDYMILLHGFVKKSPKTPQHELKTALVRLGNYRRG